MSVSFRGGIVNHYRKDFESYDRVLVHAVVSAVHVSLYSKRVLNEGATDYFLFMYISIYTYTECTRTIPKH